MLGNNPSDGLERFGQQETAGNLHKLLTNSENKNMAQQTKWAVQVYSAWQKSREGIPPLLSLPGNTDLINNILCRFFVEVKRLDGQAYSPNTLYQLACGILQYLNLNESDFRFAKIQKKIKELAAAQVKKKRSEVMTPLKERKLGLTLMYQH